MWKDNRRRHTERIGTWDVLHTYRHDYKVIFVGDATMSPYEIAYPGGSVEHNNEEPGAVWLQAAAGRLPPRGLAQSAARKSAGEYYESIGMVRELMGDRMYPLTLGGVGGGDAGVESVTTAYVFQRRGAEHAEIAERTRARSDRIDSGSVNRGSIAG